jgi:hypothetical protein
MLMDDNYPCKWSTQSRNTLWPFIHNEWRRSDYNLFSSPWENIPPKLISQLQPVISLYSDLSRSDLLTRPEPVMRSPDRNDIRLPIAIIEPRHASESSPSLRIAVPFVDGRCKFDSLLSGVGCDIARNDPHWKQTCIHECNTVCFRDSWYPDTSRRYLAPRGEESLPKERVDGCRWAKNG